MERRLKERLTGAVILVAIGVGLIPALLDGPERASTKREALSLPVPSESASTTGRTITLGADPSTAVSSTAPGPPPASPPATASTPPSTPAQRTPAARPSLAPQTSPPAATPPAPRPQPAAPDRESGWAVQVGSFSSESNARRLTETLGRSGYKAFVARHVVDGVVRFRVRVGPEPQRERAVALAERLADDGQQTRVVSHP